MDHRADDCIEVPAEACLECPYLIYSTWQATFHEIWSGCVCFDAEPMLQWKPFLCLLENRLAHYPASYDIVSLND